MAPIYDITWFVLYLFGTFQDHNIITIDIQVKPSHDVISFIVSLLQGDS